MWELQAPVSESAMTAGKEESWTLCIHGNLQCFVYAKAIDIQARDCHATEMLDLREHAGSPFSQSILNEGKFRKLALPFCVISKRRDLAVLHGLVSTACLTN